MALEYFDASEALNWEEGGAFSSRYRNPPDLEVYLLEVDSHGELLSERDSKDIWNALAEFSERLVYRLCNYQTPGKNSERKGLSFLEEELRKITKPSDTAFRQFSRLKKEILKYKPNGKCKSHKQLFEALYYSSSESYDHSDSRMYVRECIVEAAESLRKEMKEQGLGSTEECRYLINDLEIVKANEKLMVDKNLRLALWVSFKYRNRGLDIMDLIQEANQGLVRAVQCYDKRRGYKFSTSATWWIRQKVLSALNVKGGIVGKSNYGAARRNAYLEVSRRRLALEGQFPSSEEVLYEIAPAFINESCSERFEQGSTPENRRTWAREHQKKLYFLRSNQADSLNVPVSKNRSETQQDRLVDKHVPPQSQVYDEKKLKGVLDELLSQLPPKKEVIIRRFFGIGVDKMIEDSIKDLPGVKLSQTRIQQLRGEAIKWFQHPVRGKVLKPFLYG